MTKIARVALVVPALLALGVVVVSTTFARREIAVLKPQRWPVPRPSEEAWLSVAEDVALVTASGTRARGWLLPSKTGAGVALVTGASADRRQLLPEARTFSQAGYGVILFDLPGNGESDGPRWAGLEQEALTAAIDLLIARGASDPKRIGAFGFSVGAALVANAAALDQRLRAVVLAGCFSGWDDETRYENRAWGAVSGLPAIWVDRVHADGREPLDPTISIPRIGPRAALFISGDLDTVVPSGSSPRLYAVATEPKELWIIPGAGHGNYVSAAPDAYPRRLVAFFDRTLDGSPRKGDRGP